jgi:hypothetical protein
VEKGFGICHNVCHRKKRNRNLPEKEISVIDETTKQGKLALIAIHENDMAMASFAMAFTTEKAMNIIYATSSLQ